VPPLGERISQRNNCTDTKINVDGGGPGASGVGAEIPLQLVVKTMVK